MVRRRKKIIILILLLLIAIVAGSIGTYLWKESKKITGVEWFAEQQQYIDEMEKYTDSMDDIISLYVQGSISEEDFQTHLDVLNTELKAMKLAYVRDEQEHPVKTGTHSYATKKGCEAVKSCYDSLQAIIDMARNNSSDVNTIAYKYIAAHDAIIDHLADYMASYETIMDQIKEADHND